MDELTKLEMNLEKLSLMFFSSLEDVRKYAPLIPLENEESMEQSKENYDRMKIEKIENYEEVKKTYDENLVNKSADINNVFKEIYEIVNDLRNNDDFNKTDEELKKNFKDLKEWNELKVKSISDKIKHMDDIVGKIKKEGSNINNSDIDI